MMLYEMITSLKFCLSLDLSNAISSPSNFVHSNKGKMNCSHVRRRDVTCSHRKCYVKFVITLYMT